MSYNHLTLEERKIIAQMRKEKEAIRAIARELDRSPSTISREIRRNQRINKRHKLYGPWAAQRKYEARIHQQRSGKYGEDALVNYVREGLKERWSPEQISEKMKREYPEDMEMRISYKTIYRWLEKEQISQASKLRKALRHYGHKHGEGRGRLRGVRELKERPEIIRRRERLGDWEADTIVGSERDSGPCLLSLCERKSRYGYLVLLKKKTKEEVERALQHVFAESELKLESITSDRGKEFYCWKDVEQSLNIQVYFTRPSSPWQKGSVENFNGLVRQYFPKGTDFRDVTDEQVRQAMDQINQRPRKCLNWKTAAEVLLSGEPT